jgi:hypothetical protein
MVMRSLAAVWPSFAISGLCYRRLEAEGKLFEYRMVIATRDPTNAEKLAQHLLGLEEVIEFRISPTRD